jgi:hypothetical protein
VKSNNEYVNRDGDPDLCFDSVLDGAVKDFDTQMLLDPFEKQFDLPAAAIQLRDSQCRQGEMVGEEHQAFAGGRIFEANAAACRSPAWNKSRSVR